MIFLLSFGFNLYQRFQYTSLLQAYIDTEWRAQAFETHWDNEKRPLKNCAQSQNKTDVQYSIPFRSRDILSL